MANDKDIVFGMADITIGDGADVIKFDGKDYLQAEGGSLTITPTYVEFVVADFGETIIERRLSGWDASVTIVAAQEDSKILELALASTEEITDTESGSTGVMDARIGTKLTGRQVKIHPRELPESIKDMDWTIYNMASTEGFEREYNQEQGNVSITLSMMPREGFDASKPGNFFFRGGTDPNAASGE